MKFHANGKRSNTSFDSKKQICKCVKFHTMAINKNASSHANDNITDFKFYSQLNLLAEIKHKYTTDRRSSRYTTLCQFQMYEKSYNGYLNLKIRSFSYYRRIFTI